MRKTFKLAAVVVVAGALAVGAPVQLRTNALTTDPIVAAAGDIACASTTATTTTCHQKATADLLTAIQPRAVLVLGDNQYNYGTLSSYNNFFNATWGRFKATTRPVPGNHDYYTSGATGYFSYWGSLAGSPSRGYYSFNLGTWHIVALNSSIAHDASSAQVAWLKQDLSTHPSLCTLAYWHHPRWSSGGEHGNNTSVAPFWNVLYAYHADVVLNGHDHDYERFAPQTPKGSVDLYHGIREFVVGTGGKSHYGWGTIQPNSRVRNNDTFGVLKLALHSGSYGWRFVPEAGKTFTDYGSRSCA